MVDGYSSTQNIAFRTPYLIFAVSRHACDGAVTVSVRPPADELTPRVLPTGAQTCPGRAAQQLLPQIP